MEEKLRLLEAITDVALHLLEESTAEIHSDVVRALRRAASILFSSDELTEDQRAAVRQALERARH